MYFHLCCCICLLSSTVILLSNYVLLQQNVQMDMSMKKKIFFLSDDASLEWYGDIFVDVRHKQPCETTS